jgi:hypothetical protein
MQQHWTNRKCVWETNGRHRGDFGREEKRQWETLGDIERHWETMGDNGRQKEDTWEIMGDNGRHLET